MARQALTIGGAIIGSFFGYQQLGFVIGSIVGNYVDPQVIKTPGIQDLPVQTASEGGYRQVVYGTCWINTTNIIDFGDVRRVTRRERQGKGGGPVVESERLYRTYAIGLGEPLEAIRVIRRDGKIVYDVRPGSTILSDSAAFAERFRFYTGAEDQLPDPDLEALPHNGVGNTPYYRGTAYLVFPNDDLTDVQGRIPTYEVEGIKSGAQYLGDVALVTDRISYSGGYTDLAAGPSLGLNLTVDLVRVSPNGQYVAYAAQSTTGSWRFGLAKFVSGAWTFLAAPADMPVRGPNSMVWTADSQTLICAIPSGTNDTFLWVYRLTGDVLSRVSVAASPNPESPLQYSIALDADESRLAVGNANSGDTFYVFDFDGTTITNPRSEAGAGSAGGYNRLAFNPTVGSPYVAVGSSSGTGIRRVEVYEDTGSALSLVAAQNVYGDKGLYWVGEYLYAVGWDGSDLIGTVLHFDEVTEALTTVTSSIISPDNVKDTAISHDGRYIVIAQTQPKVFSVSASGFTLIETAPTATLGVESVSWSNLSTAEEIAAGQTTLSAVVEDISDRCGLATAEVDMSALDAVVVDGVTLGGGYNGADAVTLFMPAYFFDLVQPEKVLTAVVRGGASLAAVTADDFVEEPDENLLRGQDIEFPRVLMLKYLNPGQNYAAPAAVVSRTSPDVRVSGEATTDLPISFDESGALQVADRMLKVMWEDLNGEVTFSLPSGPWAWLTPTDILTLSLRGGVYRIRVEKVEESAGVLKVTARRDRQSAYTSNLTAPSLPTPTPPPPALAGDTTFVVMNLPALVDGDDALGVYIAMTGGEDTAWSGAQVEYRVQGATDWTVLGTYTTRAVMGELLANLPAASPYYTDTTNPLRVSLVYTADQLESLTYAQFLSEGNPFAIVNADFTAEVGQFRYAGDDSNGDWTLTTLQRGRLNTWAVAHSTGDTFVMLDGAIFLPLPSSVIGQTLEFRVTSIGNSPESAPTQTLVWQPQYSQYEFAPEFLALERSGGTISGSWSPRHRFGTDVYPIASVNFTGYQVTLTDGTVTNTFNTLDPEFSTSDAAYTGTITVTVAQTNRITGAGPSISESI